MLGDNELRDNVELSFSGAALKWYTYKEAAGQLSAEWRDQGGPPIVPGVRTQILAQLTPVNQMQFNEAKLRDRKQGIEERTIEYYYDVLDLCRRVDPNMGEAAKLGHLWRGLKPSVLERLWSLKPGTCEEFLQEVKRYHEMTSRTRQDEWAMGVLGKEDVGQNPSTGQGGAMERMEKMFGELMGVDVVAMSNSLRRQQMSSMPNWSRTGAN